MSKFFLRILVFAVLAACAGLTGCSLFHKKKDVSASHIYEGDAPTIHFSDKPEAAGGAINAY